MLHATELAACALAACTAIDLWLESSLLATARARIEARGGRLAELAGCRLCLSTWAALLAAALVAHGGPAGRAAIAVLAIQKGARLTHEWSADPEEAARRIAAGFRTAGEDPPA